MSYLDSYLDPTLTKLFLSIVKEGNLNEIKSNLEKYNVDVKYIKDTQNFDQNPLFFAALIKDDNEYYNINIVHYL